MKTYIYQADLLCEGCASEAAAEIHGIETLGNFDGDSDDFPCGPYADGGGESDTPAHCGRCSLFLENRLTLDGIAYVQDALQANDGNAGVLETWHGFYSPIYPLFDSATGTIH